MEATLALERAAEQHVRSLLKDTSLPIADLIPALNQYRAAWTATVYADHASSAEKKEAKLWQLHTEAKRYFHKALSNARRNTEQPVALRQVTKLYLNFIKDSERFYRDYIYTLKITYGGIPELEAIAHKVKSDGEGESSQLIASPEQRKHVLDSVHRTLIYIGDLLRYRGSEKLDKTPDFRPAIGFYDLACSLRPSSGLGHHQRAVIALEQKHHLRAIYHLYRAIVLEDPHPNAPNNLKLEFEKTNAAWDQGALIQKGSPSDPDASKNMLVGWFVRLHSMCFKGQAFRGYDELEREVLGQLVGVVKQRDLDGTLSRMVHINMAAQYYATERFKESPDDENQNALLQFMRINVKTFTALLRTFHEDLKVVEVNAESEDDDVDLTKRLTPVSCRLLPALRLYGIWLLPATPLLAGVANYDLLKEAVEIFWHIYAQTIDLLAAVFPIWDLDDLGELAYLLEEDVDTIGFKPLEDDKTHKVWYEKRTGMLKPRWSDLGAARGTPDVEMLIRIKELLADGVTLATYEDQAPLKMQGMRVLHRDAEDVVMLAIEAPPEPKNVKPAQAEQAPVKPISYAAAARASSKPQAPPKKPSKTPTASSRDAQLSRMVDNLVDDSESNTPVTPPQQHRSSPVVVTNGHMPYSALNGSTPEFVPTPKATQQKPIGSGRGIASPPAVRTPANGARNTSAERMQAVSGLWNGAGHSSMSPNFPAGLPTGTLGSPAQMSMRSHSRVNSATSVRSLTSQGYNGTGIGDSWSSLEAAQRAPKPDFGSPGMLFGLGGGPWSNGGAFTGYRNTSPPNAHGG